MLRFTLPRFILSLGLAAVGGSPGGLAQTAPPATAPALSAERTLHRIAFGSCVKESQPQPIWAAISATRPDVFIFTGDNVYADTEDVAVMRAKYAKLAADPGFAALRSACPLLATWDDHDYGKNDAGAEYPMKRESQQVMLDFFGEPADSPRRKREGVYDARVFGPAGRRVQIILLDTRYFRSPLTRGPEGRPGDGRLGRYVPNEDPAATMLGAEQWAWLEAQLRVEAELRIIVSSIQVIAEDHRFEKWGNLPRERERLFNLIRDTRAAGVIFISGDRHLAELSRMRIDAGYEVYDVTSSALNQKSRGWYNEINRHRHGSNYRDANFGLISIDWEAPDPTIDLEIRQEDGAPAIWHQIKLSELRPR